MFATPVFLQGGAQGGVEAINELLPAEEHPPSALTTSGAWALKRGQISSQRAGMPGRAVSTPSTPSRRPTTSWVYGKDLENALEPSM
jgi:hypothetical protein